MKQELFPLCKLCSYWGLCDVFAFQSPAVLLWYLGESGYLGLYSVDTGSKGTPSKDLELD